MCNKLGRLSKGWNKHKGTPTPPLKTCKNNTQREKAMHAWVVYEIKTKKFETHQVFLTVGGNMLDHPGIFITPTVDLETVNLHWNIIISKPIRQYMCMNVK